MIIGGAHQSRGVVSLSLWRRETWEGATMAREHSDRRCVPMALDYVARSASNRVSRFVWNLIPLREGSWNQDTWRGGNRTGEQATPSARRTRRRRRRFSFAVAINRTYVTFSTFQLYWIGRAVSAIDSVTRAMRLSRVLDTVFGVLTR